MKRLTDTELDHRIGGSEIERNAFRSVIVFREEPLPKLHTKSDRRPCLDLPIYDASVGSRVEKDGH